MGGESGLVPSRGKANPKLAGNPASVNLIPHTIVARLLNCQDRPRALESRGMNPPHRQFPLSLPSAAVLLTATLLLSATVLLLEARVSAEVIWRGDFETGTTEQWRGTAPKNDSVKVVTDPVRAGKYALRIDGTNAAKRGDRDRIEFQHQPKPPGTAEGTERYFGWSVFLPKKLTDDAHALGYFETRNSWRQLMSFEVRGEDILLQHAGAVRPPLDRQGKAHARPLARLCRSRPVVARSGEGLRRGLVRRRDRWCRGR